MHFNENSENKHAERSDSIKRYAVAYPKKKKGEAAVVKPVKEKSTYGNSNF